MTPRWQNLAVHIGNASPDYRQEARIWTVIKSALLCGALLLGMGSVVAYLVGI
jgi:hypothetical protein